MVAHSAPSQSLSLEFLDGTRIAVELNLAGICRTVCGLAHYERDPLLGNVLRILLDMTHQSCSTEVLISERDWDGEIVRLAEVDCAYCLKSKDAA
ncbi:MAG: hypothetical protein RIC55_04910 [Pirellulaceae bacterium]